MRTGWAWPSRRIKNSEPDGSTTIIRLLAQRRFVRKDCDKVRKLRISPKGLRVDTRCLIAFTLHSLCVTGSVGNGHFADDQHPPRIFSPSAALLISSFANSLTLLRHVGKARFCDCLNVVHPVMRTSTTSTPQAWRHRPPQNFAFYVFHHGFAWGKQFLDGTFVDFF